MAPSGRRAWQYPTSPDEMPSPCGDKISIYLSIYLSIDIYMYQYPYLYLSIYIYLSIDLPIDLSIYVSTRDVDTSRYDRLAHASRISAPSGRRAKQPPASPDTMPFPCPAPSVSGLKILYGNGIKLKKIWQ